MRVHNVTRGTEVAGEARVARSYWSRMVGLLGRSSLAPGEGLIIKPCTSVHTAFMRFTIDVLYVDASGQVVKAVPELKPFRLSGARRGAHSVIELPKGSIASSSTVAGDQLAFEG